MRAFAPVSSSIHLSHLQREMLKICEMPEIYIVHLLILCSLRFIRLGNTKRASKDGQRVLGKVTRGSLPLWIIRDFRFAIKEKVDASIASFSSW